MHDSHLIQAAILKHHLKAPGVAAKLFSPGTGLYYLYGADAACAPLPQLPPPPLPLPLPGGFEARP